MKKIALSIFMLLCAILISQFTYSIVEGRCGPGCKRRWDRIFREREAEKIRLEEEQRANRTRYENYLTSMKDTGGVASSYSDYLESLFEKHVNDQIAYLNSQISQVGRIEGMTTTEQTLFDAFKDIKNVNQEIQMIRGHLKENRKRRETDKSFKYHPDPHIRRIKNLKTPKEELRYMLEHIQNTMNTEISNSAKLYMFTQMMKMVYGYDDANHNLIMQKYGLILETTGDLKQLIIKSQYINDTTFGDMKYSNDTDLRHKLDPSNPIFISKFLNKDDEYDTYIHDIKRKAIDIIKVL
jgi:hypothetical protein